MYDSIEQVDRYLVGTVVMYDHNPYFVARSLGTDKAPSIMMLELPGQRRELVCSVSDPLLNYQSYQLGYVNLDDGNIVYCRRLPKRQQQQGLSRRNIDTNGVEFDRLIRNRGFAMSLVNNYPSLVAAEKLLNEGTFMVAISQRIAVSFDPHNALFNFWYRGRSVGSSSQINVVQRLLEPQLKEVLSEHLEVA